MSAASKLSAERFQQIVGTLKSDTRQSKGSEKRTEGRVGLRSMLDILAASTEGGPKEAITVWVRDISVNGLGFVTSKKIERKSEFIARFDRWKLPPMAIVYKVTYSRQISAELYSIGARLKQVLEELPATNAA